MKQGKQIVFIGTYADNEYLKELISKKIYEQFAANQTEEYYIRGLKAWCSDVTVFSALVVPSFPHCRCAVIPAREANINGCAIHNVSFLNLPIIRFISQTYQLCKQIKQNFDGKDNTRIVVIVYAMRLSFYMAAKYIKKKYPDAICVNIVPDMPMYMHMNEINVLSHLKGRINQWVLLKGTKFFDGFVLYAKAMREIIHCDEDNSIVLEGIVSESQALDMPITHEEQEKQIVLYAGGLEKKYGVKLLAEGFIEANIPNTELHFYGKGDYSDELILLAKKHPNIKYFGVVEPSHTKDKMREASLLVNPRPSDETFTRYSCPSKILEYMESGVPVMTTKLGGIPDNYFEYLYVIQEESVSGVSRALREFFNENNEVHRMRATKARRYITNCKNCYVQARNLLSFVDSLKKDYV